MENISLSSVKRVVNQALCKKEKFKKREKKNLCPISVRETLTRAKPRPPTLCASKAEYVPFICSKWMADVCRRLVCVRLQFTEGRRGGLS